jgi:peptidoglycan/LPS O-acetylase OafA/YrhL
MTRSRNQPLDILRGMAIFLVLTFHFSYFHWLWQIGWTGVDLFFVLSGFLISGLLFDEYSRTGGISLKRFWIRRAFKIYPPYYVLIAVTAASFLITRGKVPGRLLSECFFISNYLPHVWPHMWSLAVEEHFYFMLPLLLVLIIRLKFLRAVPLVFLSLAVGCLVLRVLEFRMGASAAALHSETHLRIDSLFSGVAIRYWKTFYPSSFKRAAAKPLYIPGIILILPALWVAPAGWFMDTAGLSMLYAGYGLLLVWAVERPPSKNALARSLAWVGKHSYSIYLWHLPLWALLYAAFGRVSLAFFAIGILSSIGFGACMAWFVETPSIAIRDKLFPFLGGAGHSALKGGKHVRADCNGYARL